ncbi:MAG: asparagine synthase (glutamine-hydrolyzing), partial [Gammaproteobacteria bacterium]
MCGIFGIINQAKNKKITFNFLKHRGPDYFGTYTSENGVYLAHNRLSIIGLDKNSNQPMHGPNGTVIVFNGEIYNYKDLKNSELSGYPFKSNSDTEVILALYEKYKFDCVQYLRGMFAFAIWDEKEKCLFCARDRFGIKPFYYTKNEKNFGFASEMKALLPFVSSIDTNHEALSEYLIFQYTIGAETLFQNISQLMPGHILIYKGGDTIIKKYWDVSYQIDYNRSAKYFEEKLESLLKDSIKYHQISDVPIGSYLSGGIDSSLITILAAESNPNFYGSFHGRFTDYPGYDESIYANEASLIINKPLYTINIT